MGKVLDILLRIKTDTGQARDEFGRFVKRTEDGASRLNKAFAVNQAIEFAQKISDAFGDVIGTGVEFEASLAAVGAITGQTGEKLDVLGVKARELALTFGGSATDQLASFQGVLSKFGAQVADTPAALTKLSTNINILSAASGDDAKTSMNAVTDAMLQFGLVTGDSTKDAESSTRVINALAASAQVGAAEIPQVAAAILQAGVAAKGANLSFESTNAALQVLAVGGKVGSEAGVGLRNVLGLLQKASGPAEETMTKLGTSSKELGEILTTQGLDAALLKLKGGMDSLGTAAERNSALMTIFGTENSATAGILLGNVDKFKEFEDGIKAGQEGTGAAFEQAAIRMNTAQTGISQATAFIKDQFVSVFQVFGTGLSTALGATAQIAPLATTLIGLKEVFPVEAAGKFAKVLVTETIPGLFKSVAGYLASAGAKSAEAVATGGATIAQTALNAVMSANPVFLLVTGVVALVGVYALLSSGTKDLGEATTDANTAMTKLQDATATASAVKKNSEAIDTLADKYKKLQVSTALIAASGGDASSAQKELAATADELAQKVPSAADAIGDLRSKLDENGPSVAINTKELKAYNDEQEKIANSNAADAQKDFTDKNKELLESLAKNTEKIAELREEREKLNTPQGQEQAKALDGLENAVGGPLLGFAKLVGIVDTADEKLGTVREKIGKLSPEIEKANTQLKAGVEEYARQGFSISDIEKALGRAKGELDKFVTPDFKNSLVNSDALKESIKGMNEQQQQVVNKVINQTEALQAAQTKAGELKESIANALAIGDTDTAEKLKKDLEGVKADIEKQEIDLKVAVDETETKKTLEALPENAKKILKPLTATVDVLVSDNSLKETQQASGKLIREITELQKQQGAATDENQKKLLNDKINEKTAELTKNFGKQGEAIAANSDRLNELKAQREKALGSGATAEANRLTGEIGSLEKKTGDASKRFVDAANSSAKVGATKGDIKELAGSYGTASNAGRGIGIAMKTAAENTKEVGEAARDAGEEFAEAQKKASDLVNNLANTYAANLIKLKGDLDDIARAKIEAQQAEIKRQAQAINADLRNFKSANDAARQELGFNTEADAKASREKARRDAENRRKERAAIIRHNADLRAIRQKSAADEIDDELAKNLREIQIDLEKARADQRAAVVEAGSDDAAIRAARRQFETAVETAKANRTAAVEKARKAYGLEVLRLQNELTEQEIGLLRDDAAQITETDVRSIQERTDAVLAALTLEGRAKLNKKLEENEKFKLKTSELGEQASSAEIDARLKVAAAQEAIDNKIAELQIARDTARALAKKKNLTDPGELTDEEIKKALGDAGLLGALKDAQAGVNEAHAVLVEKMTALRASVLDALRLKPEDRSQIQRDLIASLNLSPDEERKLLTDLENIARDTNRAVKTQVLKSEEELKTAQLEARLATITNVAERARLQSEIEARKTLQAELDQLDRAEIALQVRREQLAAEREQSQFIGPTLDDVAVQSEQDKINKAREAAQLRFRALQRKNELDALRESNVAVDGALQLQLGIYKTFYGELDKARRDDLQKQKDALSKAGEDLIAQLQTDKINLEQFFTERQKNRADQAKLDAELGGVNEDFWDGFRRAGEVAFKSLGENRSKVLDDSLVKLNTTIADQLSRVEASGKVGSFSLRAIADTAIEAGKEAVGVIGAAWGQMALSGKATLGDFADAAITTSLKTIRTIIEGNIIGIISAAFAINPFVGILSIPAVFIVEALLAKWEGEAQSRLGAHGFFHAGYTGDGDPHGVAGVVHKREMVFDHVTTALYRPQFELIHQGVDPYTVFGRDEPLRAVTLGLHALEHHITRVDQRISGVEDALAFATEIERSMRPGNDWSLYIQTEANIAAARETTQAVDRQTTVMQEQFKMLSTELREDLKSMISAQRDNTAETRTTNERLGKNGYGSSSIADQLEKMKREIIAELKNTGGWR